MRKRNLARAAERTAQAKATAVAAAAASSTPSAGDTTAATPEYSGPVSETVRPESLPQSTSALVASPVHPSLPPKPPTTIPPAKPVSPEIPGSAAAVQSSTLAPATTSAAVPEAAAPVDKQIREFEEVGSFLRVCFGGHVDLTGIEQAAMGLACFAHGTRSLFATFW